MVTGSPTSERHCSAGPPRWRRRLRPRRRSRARPGSPPGRARCPGPCWWHLDEKWWKMMKIHWRHSNHWTRMKQNKQTTTYHNHAVSLSARTCAAFRSTPRRCRGLRRMSWQSMKSSAQLSPPWAPWSQKNNELVKVTHVYRSDTRIPLRSCVVLHAPRNLQKTTGHNVKDSKPCDPCVVHTIHSSTTLNTSTSAAQSAFSPAIPGRSPARVARAALGYNWYYLGTFQRMFILKNIIISKSSKSIIIIIIIITITITITITIITTITTIITIIIITTKIITIIVITIIIAPSSSSSSSSVHLRLLLALLCLSSSSPRTPPFSQTPFLSLQRHQGSGQQNPNQPPEALLTHLRCQRALGMHRILWSPLTGSTLCLTSFEKRHWTCWNCREAPTLGQL